MMIKRVAQKLDRSRKLLLFAVGWLAVAVPGSLGQAGVAAAPASSLPANETLPMCRR
jgi:hypothetical protein